MRCFERNCTAKWVIFFASLSLLWDFLLENLKLKKLWWCPLEDMDDYKKFFWPKLYFQDKNYKCEILNHLYFCPNFAFLLTASVRFGQCSFLIFCRRPTKVACICTHLYSLRFSPVARYCCFFGFSNSYHHNTWLMGWIIFELTTTIYSLVSHLQTLNMNKYWPTDLNPAPTKLMTCQNSYAHVF